MDGSRPRRGATSLAALRSRPRGGSRGVAAALSRLLLLLVVSTLAGVLVAGLVLPVASGVGLVARDSVDSFDALPVDLQVAPLAQNSRVLASDGSVIATFFDQNRVVVPFAAISPEMRKAIVAIEDSRFYEHGGIDLRGTLRAFVNNQSGQAVQGGSTITQQYVKNALLESALSAGDKEAAAAATEDTYGRKLRELRYAIALEDRLSKDEILERYLNIAYFGNGAYGVEAAAQTYFAKPASDLDAHEAALIAGLVKNPSAYDPYKHPEAALGRRNVVLARMGEVGALPADQVAPNQARPLGLKRGETRTGCVTSLAPFFCEYVKYTILRDPIFGADPADRQRLLFRGGLTIQSTIDPKAQQAAQQAIDARTNPTDKVATVLASVEPGTGQIKAMAQSRGYGDGKGNTHINYAVGPERGGGLGIQSGSTFKPFVAAGAIDQGYGLDYQIFSPYQLQPEDADGIPTCGRPWPNVKDIPQADGTLDYYKPTNTTTDESGVYSMRDAMAKSINTYFIKLEKLAGLCEPATLAKDMGVYNVARGRDLDQVASFTLGVGNVTPLMMAEAYATFAAHGVHCTSVAVTGVTDREGRTLPVPAGKCEEVLDPDTADAVTRLLQDVMENGTGRGSQLVGRPSAGKTGTTSGPQAVWFIGYTPELTTAVAAYNPTPPDPKKGYPLRNVRIGGRYYAKLYGASLPAPIWNDMMEATLEGRPASQFEEPPSRFFDGSKGPGDFRRPQLPSDQTNGFTFQTQPARQVVRTPAPRPRPTVRPTATASPRPSPKPTPTATTSPRPTPKPTPKPTPSPSTSLPLPSPRTTTPPTG